MVDKHGNIPYTKRLYIRNILNKDNQSIKILKWNIGELDKRIIK